MKRAFLHLRHIVSERRKAFSDGLERFGFTVVHGLDGPTGTQDLLCVWNRIGASDRVAKEYEARGLTVIVAENAAWGNGFLGRKWISLAKDRHNTAGMFLAGGSERWDALGVELAPWRTEGETVILPQRGIGSPPTVMPANWAKSAYQRHGGRVRPHPGRNQAKPLADDLAKCGRVVTWGSGAAIQALMIGIPVISEMPDWIGAQSNTDEDRLRMFRELAWAQWELREIESGEAFEGFL